MNQTVRISLNTDLLLILTAIFCDALGPKIIPTNQCTRSYYFFESHPSYIKTLFTDSKPAFLPLGHKLIKCPQWLAFSLQKCHDSKKCHLLIDWSFP